VFASGHTWTPERVVQFVQESVESFCFDGRNGSRRFAGRYVPARVVQRRCETLGSRAVEA